MQHFKSSYRHFQKHCFFLLGPQSSIIFAFVRCFKALREAQYICSDSQVLHWVLKVPTHGHIGSAFFRGLRKWPLF